MSLPKHGNANCMYHHPSVIGPEPALQVPSCSSICMYRVRSESSTWFNVHIKAKRSTLERVYVNGRSVTWPHSAQLQYFSGYEHRSQNCVESIVGNVYIFCVFVTSSKVISSKKIKAIGHFTSSSYLPYKLYYCNARNVYR